MPKSWIVRFEAPAFVFGGYLTVENGGLMATYERGRAHRFLSQEAAQRALATAENSAPGVAQHANLQELPA